MPTSRWLGEREIIEIIWKQIEKMPHMPVAFGDDVSAIEIDAKRLAILKTDMLVGKTDVPPGMSLRQAARKAVVMNISDFAAKGVKPVALLVSLGLPGGLTREQVVEIGKGLNAGAREYGAYVIGGDTGEASDPIVSVSLLGLARKDSLMLRTGARPGDVVAVTGVFGRVAAGLRILRDDLKAQPRLRRKLIEPVLMPRARLSEGLALNQTRAVTSSIDSSDGLAWSLHEIARMSEVGFLIDKLLMDGDVEKFAKLNKLDPLELTLYGGEEYELVLTVKPELWEKADRAIRRVGGELLPIGRVTAEKRMFLKLGRKRTTIEPRGWEHFKSDRV